MHVLFLTRDGRPALLWRILLALFVLIAILVLFFDIPAPLLAELLHLPIQDVSSLMTGNINFQVLLLPIYLLGGLLMIRSTLWLRRHVDHRSTAGLTLTPLAGHHKELVLGWLLGGFIPCGAACVAGLSGLFTLQPRPISWSHLAVACLFWIGSGLCSALRDEVLLRGYILQNLGERLPLWIATLLLALLSILLHLLDPGFLFAGCLHLLVLSTVWTCTRLLTRSLWLAIGIHAGLNTCTALLFTLILHIGPTSTLTGILIGLEIPFSTMLLIALACWMLTRRLRINWKQHLREEGQPAVTVAYPLGMS